ncbi:MAG TPA: GreA/GreB family elongation factor [Jatrophihabitans sp.]|jgi:transcription elongation factor GreA
MTTATPPRSAALAARLERLQAERAEVMGELFVSNGGDTADRATNVDANARLTLLEQRIATVEEEIINAGRQKTGSTGVSVGDVVTVDLGDGPEPYLFGSVEQAGDGMDVITQASPLGRAIEGAAVGTTVTYRTRAGRELTATVIAIS